MIWTVAANSRVAKVIGKMRRVKESVEREWLWMAVGATKTIIDGFFLVLE